MYRDVHSSCGTHEKEDGACERKNSADLRENQPFAAVFKSELYSDPCGHDDLQLLHLFADVPHFAVLSDLCAAVAISILSFVVSDPSSALGLCLLLFADTVEIDSYTNLMLVRIGRVPYISGISCIF